MKRAVPFCSMLLVLGGLWLARTSLQHHAMHLKSIAQDNLAQRLVGTRFLNSPRAHALLADYADLYRYRSANQSLPSGGPDRVVFFGDSITDFWATYHPAQFFPGSNYVDRGITGQTSREMVWRFQQDVLDLHPSGVVILAGANDIVLPSRHLTHSQTMENLQAMVQAAKLHGIRVVICSILPVSSYPPPAEASYTQQIRSINLWLQRYADAQHITYLDYFTPMSTPTGAMNSSFSNDGLHPNSAGYALMQSLASSALATH
jgi:acyl-CoA thioesterase-1